MAGDESVWLDLGFAIYRRRLELGINSQRDLAERAGLHYNTVSRIELGQQRSRRSQAWAALDAALEWPDGYIAEFVATRTRPATPALTANQVERAVLDSIAEIAPQLTVRQARLISAATAARLERDGLLGRPGG